MSYHISCMVHRWTTKGRVVCQLSFDLDDQFPLLKQNIWVVQESYSCGKIRRISPVPFAAYRYQLLLSAVVLYPEVTSCFSQFREEELIALLHSLMYAVGCSDRMQVLMCMKVELLACCRDCFCRWRLYFCSFLCHNSQPGCMLFRTQIVASLVFQTRSSSTLYGLDLMNRNAWRISSSFFEWISSIIH